MGVKNQPEILSFSSMIRLLFDFTLPY